MNQPQPQPQQNANISINSSFDNYTIEQRYKNLTKDTANLFNTRTQEQKIEQFLNSLPLLFWEHPFDKQKL
ncbi:hypothetical protein F8M41_016837 [Gigaspora margarita]|uniref:Uncharacterized protein n=1 Tax=Gigaspora margarita TaxID=4874 RepID=A0A8H4ANX8_GIGMA|nr:hypothetical protein F8M41_016837 [Gigaspora margarita]